MKAPLFLVGIAILFAAGAQPVHAAAAPGTTVSGNKTASKNEVTMAISGNYRIITSNGIPDHPLGDFPNRNNPNSVTPQQNYFRIPLHPVIAANTTPYGLGRFGVALNGVPFEAAGAEFWNGDFNSGWQYEVLKGKINLGTDASNAHVQPSGSYHYHGLPAGLITKLGGDSPPKMLLLGYAGDGFPIYNQYGHTDPKDLKSPLKKMRPSYALKKGDRPGNPGGPYDGTFTQDYEYKTGSGDLDDSNGRLGVTPEYPAGIYHYCLTETFPIIPRQFRGTPDGSFMQPGPGGGRRGPPPLGGPPPGLPPPRGGRPGGPPPY